MRKYETVFISDPDLQDQTRSDLFDKVRNIIAKENGIVLDFDEWGNKKLAYEIKKKSRGHYVCVTYTGSGALVTELERNFRLTDDVLKFMTIVLSEDLTREQLDEEITKVQDAAEKAAEEAVKAEAPAEEAAEEKTDTEETAEEKVEEAPAAAEEKAAEEAPAEETETETQE